MHDYFEVIEETETHRVALIDDQDAFAPDWDGQGYVFSVYDGATVETRHRDSGDIDPNDVEGALQSAILRWGLDWDMVERYLRTFHDVTSFDYATPERGHTYICTVTRSHVELWGCPEEHIPAAAAGTLKAWSSWAEGETFGWVIESRAKHADDSWFEVDSCYGYCGHEDAEQVAREEFTTYTEEN